MEIQKALERAPNRATLLADKARVYYHSGDFGASLQTHNDLVKLEPWNWNYRLARARAWVALDRFDEAISDYNRALADQPATSMTGKGGLAYALARAGKKDAARAVLDELLRHSDEPRITDGLALAYTALGEPDKAIDWLEQGYERRDPWMMTINVEPRFASLRGHPRVRELLKKMRLESAEHRLPLPPSQGQ